MSGSGLTLGKYAPFHRGHQHLIDTALAEVDHLTVLVYDTDVTPIPLQVRANWIRRLYPHVEVIEAWDGPPGYGDTEAIMREQEAYILARLGGRQVTHFYSSEFYGAHVSAALGAVDRRVDPERRAMPISGTAIRAEPFANRRHLDPLVYRDLVVTVCFYGAPSTGKTTLAQVLAERHGTRFMPEYGAEYWREHHCDRRITLAQFEEIAPEHYRREEALLPDCDRYLFCDTSPLTTYHFAKDYHGRAGPVLTACARDAERRYDLCFLCGTDIPYADTWDRSGDQKRQWFQNLIEGDLRERRIPYLRLRGDLETRIAKVEAVLARFVKFRGLLPALGVDEA